jgi:hypothetical protein
MGGSEHTRTRQLDPTLIQSIPEWYQERERDAF